MEQPLNNLCDNSADYNIRSIMRAIAIVNVIAQSPKRLSLTDISLSSHLSKTTVLRILSNLQRAGWVYRFEDERYSLGFKLLAISKNVESALTSYKAIHDVLLRVSADTHETVLFSIWDGSDAVCVDKVTGTFYVSVVQVVNEITPINAGATGFATLMTMKEADAKEILCKNNFTAYTANTPTTIESLLCKYDEMQKNGYVVTVGEKDEGIVGIAIGVYLGYEKVHGSISIVAPENRVDKPRLASLVERLLLEKKRLDAIV